MDIKKLGGRKFNLVVGIFLISALLTYLGKIDADQYQAICFMIISTYVVGNVAQKFIEKKAE